MRKISLLLAVVMLFGFAVTASAERADEFIQLRLFADTGNVTASWDNDARAVTITGLKNEVVLYFGENYYGEACCEKITKNGEVIELETTPVIKDGYTYVPKSVLTAVLGSEQAANMIYGMLLSVKPIEKTEKIETLTDGVLIIGMEISFPPFGSYDTDGVTPIGFDVDLAKAIGEKIGLDVEFVNVLFDTIFAGIGEKYDCVISAVTVTEERKAKYDFSTPYVKDYRNPYSLLGEDFEDDGEDFAVAVSKGNTRLLYSINEALAELEEEGVIAELSEKWLAE